MAAADGRTSEDGSCCGLEGRWVWTVCVVGWAEGLRNRQRARKLPMQLGASAPVPIPAAAITLMRNCGFPSMDRPALGALVAQERGRGGWEHLRIPDTPAQGH